VPNWLLVAGTWALTVVTVVWLLLLASWTVVYALDALSKGRQFTRDFLAVALEMHRRGLLPSTKDRK
jgi:hypothetical protein